MRLSRRELQEKIKAIYSMTDVSRTRTKTMRREEWTGGRGDQILLCYRLWKESLKGHYTPGTAYFRLSFPCIPLLPLSEYCFDTQPKSRRAEVENRNTAYHYWS
jgi:hypothetical protein